MIEIIPNPSQQNAADEPHCSVAMLLTDRNSLYWDCKVSVQQKQFREGLLFFTSATLALMLSECRAGTESCPAPSQAERWRPGHLGGNPGVRTQLSPPELRPQLAPHVQPWGSAVRPPSPHPGHVTSFPGGTEGLSTRMACGGVWARARARATFRERHVRAESSDPGAPGGTSATVRGAG